MSKKILHAGRSAPGRFTYRRAKRTREAGAALPSDADFHKDYNEDKPRLQGATTTAQSACMVSTFTGSLEWFVWEDNR